MNKDDIFDLISESIGCSLNDVPAGELEDLLEYFGVEDYYDDFNKMK